MSTPRPVESVPASYSAELAFGHSDVELSVGSAIPRNRSLSKNGVGFGEPGIREERVSDHSVSDLLHSAMS